MSATARQVTSPSDSVAGWIRSPAPSSSAPSRWPTTTRRRMAPSTMMKPPVTSWSLASVTASQTPRRTEMVLARTALRARSTRSRDMPSSSWMTSTRATGVGRERPRCGARGATAPMAGGVSMVEGVSSRGAMGLARRLPESRIERMRRSCLLLTSSLGELTGSQQRLTRALRRADLRRRPVRELPRGLRPHSSVSPEYFLRIFTVPAGVASMHSRHSTHSSRFSLDDVQRAVARPGRRCRPGTPRSAWPRAAGPTRRSRRPAPR